MRRMLLVLCTAVATVAATSVPGAAQSCYDVSVFAGRGIGDGGPATDAVLIAPRNVVADAAGNLLIADSGNSRVRRFDAASNTVTTIAGNGALGSPQDGVPALTSALNVPSGVAVDAAGNVYIVDQGSDTVMRLTPDGVLHRFAGSGIRTGTIDGPGGNAQDDLNDGFAATIGTLNHPLRVALDGAGNVYISDGDNHRVRKVDSAGTITTVVGPGTPGAPADGLFRPAGLAFGPGNVLYISDNGSGPDETPANAHHQVWKFDGTALTLVAGEATTGAPGPASSTPVVAVGATLDHPGDLAVDASGRLYIGDTGNNMVRRVTTPGMPGAMIERVVGDGNPIPGCVDGPGLFTRLENPGVALTPSGDALIIPDTAGSRIRRYSSLEPLTGTTTTLVGRSVTNSDEPCGIDPGDGGPAAVAFLQRPTGLALDAAGNVFVSEHDSRRIRMIDRSGTITTVVNTTGLNNPPTPGGPAIDQGLQQPTGLGFVGGNLLIVDAIGNQVYVVDQGGHGTLNVFAGTLGGTCPVPGENQPPDPCGDGGAAAQATLNTPLRIASAGDGAVFIADFGDDRVRRVDAQSVITTFAGRGFAGHGGDGGPASQALLNNPAALAFDASGNLYIADFGNEKIRKVDTAGNISTVAGVGNAGAGGDGAAAGSAQLSKPTGMSFAADGALLFADQGNNKIRRIAPDASGAISSASTISTIIGDGTAGFADGPALSAKLLAPSEVLVLPDGRLLIADRGNHRVRVATPNGTCAGSGGGGGTCPSAAGCIPGGGPRKTDCLMETLVRGVRTRSPKATCKDGDADCDSDSRRGTCTFSVALCFNEPGCPASGVTRFVVKGSGAGTLVQGVATLASANPAGNTVSFPQPFTTASACTDVMSVAVPLKKNGRKQGTMKLAMKAFGAGRTKDKDTIRLVCVP